MRLTTVILIASLMQVSAAGLAQKITLSERNVSLVKVFDKISIQSGFDFLVSEDVLSSAKLVTIRINNMDFEDALNKIFESQSLRFSIKEKTVVVSKKEPSFLERITTLFAGIDVYGVVVDSQNSPLAGATVAVKDGKRSTTTGTGGQFLLKGVPEDAILQISFMGYTTKEVKANANLMRIKLELSTSKLDEVQVIAYGSTTRRLNTGSVSTITAEDIAKQPVLNVLQAMEGKMTGVFITQNSGIVGSNYNIQVEGQNSLRNTSSDNGNLPLYIIDGIPYPAGTLSSSFSPYSFTSSSDSRSIGASPLNGINPQDIASIDVLKDADATAIYGSRGANGVVLITTKKGKIGDMKIDANIYSGTGKVTRKIKMLNTDQYITMRTEAFANDKLTPIATDYDMNGIWDKTRYTDWQKELIGGNAVMTDGQFSVSGGSTASQYRFGGGYHHETTVFPTNDSDQRINFSSSISANSPNKKFTSHIGLNYAYNLTNLSTDFTSAALTLAPNAPALYDGAGNLNWENNTFQNPLSSTKQPYKVNTYTLTGNGNLSYELMKDLRLSANFGYTNISVDELRKVYKTSLNPISAALATLNSSFGDNSITSWIIEPQINWGKMFGKNHIHVLAGATLQSQVSESLNRYAVGFLTEDQMENVSSVPASNVVSTYNYLTYKYAALFGRISYDWDTKYLLTLSARRDGSSRFGPNKQFANFGALGVAWIFSKENFIANELPFLSFGKLRGSYGITGNDQIGDYGFLDTYKISGQYQNIAGLEPARLFNPDFRWEKNKKMEVALETGFLQDRILANISYYYNHSSNQLVGYALPPNTGFSAVQYNLPAIVQNTGLQVEITTVNISNQDFKWSSNFNLTVPKNKLKSYPNLAGSSYANTYVVGEPLSIKKGYTVTGVDPQTGLYVTQDVNGDGSYTLDDYNSINFMGQRFFGMLGNNIKYKEFQLDFYFQFVKQSSPNYLSFFFVPGTTGNQPLTVLNRWQKPGDVTSVQRFGTDVLQFPYNSWKNYRNSNAIVSDASFIRLKNVSVSYNLPSNFTKDLKINNLRVYLQTQNLLTFTSYLGPDPETQATSLPPLRYITLGAQITL